MRESAAQYRIARELSNNKLNTRIERMKGLLDERQWRLYLANEAIGAGYGGVSKASRISGVSRTTITKGVEELKNGNNGSLKVRKSGGGRKYVEEKYPKTEENIHRLIDGATYGNPKRILSYTTESLRKIEKELKDRGINVSHETVCNVVWYAPTDGITVYR